MSDQLHKYDALLKDAGPAAIVLTQHLQPVEGMGGVIFPPTYAAPDGEKDSSARYNLDGVECHKAKACVLDSIGSQANRIEPLFKSNKLRHLVPQITVAHAGGTTNLLDAGHRIADAIVRFSELLPEIHDAFVAHREGDATAMAKLAPTTLVFGAWDSRGTQHKIKRLINFRIDASDVELRTRSAQYNPALDYVGMGLIDEVDNSTGSDLGFASVPAPGQLGGVVVRGAIIRTGTVNLTTLKAMAGDSQLTDLHRYILGLVLVALTELEAGSLSLRQGCQLVGIPEKTTSLETVMADGGRKAFALTAQDALDYASAAAKAFGVGKDRTVAFDSKLANKMRAAWSVDKIRTKLKDLAKTAPLTLAAIEEVEAAVNAKNNKKATKS